MGSLSSISETEKWVIIWGDNLVEELYSNLPEIENVGINVVRFSTQKNDGLGNKISIVLDHSKIENAVDFLF